MFLEFTSGDLTGQRRQITDYVGATRTFVFANPFLSAPSADDPFVLQLDVTVNNLPPTIEGWEVVTPNPLEGSQVSVRVEATDPGGEGDPLRYEFDFFNDNTIDAVSFTGQAWHFFPDDGTFPVRVVVSDDEGATASTIFDVIVANVEPSLALRGPLFIDEGETYELTLAITDPGDDTLDAYSIDWDDGSAVEDFSFDGMPDLMQTHVYQADGNYTIVATSVRPTTYQIRVFGLSDEDGDYLVEETQDVTVRNVSPTINLTGNPLADFRDPFELILGDVVDPATTR